MCFFSLTLSFPRTFSLLFPHFDTFPSNFWLRILASHSSYHRALDVYKTSDSGPISVVESSPFSPSHSKHVNTTICQARSFIEDAQIVTHSFELLISLKNQRSPLIRESLLTLTFISFRFILHLCYALSVLSLSGCLVLSFTILSGFGLHLSSILATSHSAHVYSRACFRARTTQSRSVVHFKPYKVNWCFSDDLDMHIKGAAFWDEDNGSVGYYVFNPLSRSPLPIEYNEDSCQWVFIALNSRTRNWIATDMVPQAYRLGRQSIKHSTVQAAEVDPEETFEVTETVEEEKTSDAPSSMIPNHIYSSAMSRTMAALTLARTATTGSHFTGFSRKGKGPAFEPYISGGGGGPLDSRPGGPPGRGPPGGGGGGGGGIFPLPRPGAGAGGGGGKLGGNPPRIFDDTCSEADAFMNEFSLYCLINIGTDQIDSPMKRDAFLLGFIQGEKVKDSAVQSNLHPLCNVQGFGWANQLHCADLQCDSARTI